MTAREVWQRILVVECAERGYTDIEIAELVGCLRWQVVMHRQAVGLRENRKPVEVKTVLRKAQSPDPRLSGMWAYVPSAG